MGKKQAKEKKKFDRNVEISAPILDPQAIKAIHTDPFAVRKQLDIKSFKVLLGCQNSLESTDEVTPLNENHVPSYIGISCAVSGYSNYSSYNRRPASPASTVKSSTTPIVSSFNPSRSRTTSPVANNQHRVNHITIDKNHVQSADEERKELTEKLTASAAEPRRCPSPCIPPTEDDRHHGAYVGARYCPLPPPSKVVNKHIPLLGIDDDQNPDEIVEQDENKVEQKIASLYGDEFVEDWRESMTHKTKKEIASEPTPTTLKSPKDLVSLKPAPPTPVQDTHDGAEIDIPTPNVKVLASVEKQFLNKLLTDENPPMPAQAALAHSVPEALHGFETKLKNDVKSITSASSESKPPTSPVQGEILQSAHVDLESQSSPQHVSPPMSPDSGKSQSIGGEDFNLLPSSVGEEHIEYEIRAQSPVDNNASPVKIPHHQMEEQSVDDEELKHNLVSFSPEPAEMLQKLDLNQQESNIVGIQAPGTFAEDTIAVSNNNEEQGGRYYLDLSGKEKSSLLELIEKAKAVLDEDEALMDQDIKGTTLSAIGKSSLLVNKKFKQFEELCEANINRKADEQFATLNDDLAGFWDMLSIQVSDVRKSFNILWEAKKNNWQSVDSNKAPFSSGLEDKDGEVEDIARSTNRDKSSKPKLSALKDQERRDRLQGHINQMKQNQALKTSSEILLNDPEDVSGRLEEQPAASTNDQPLELAGGSEPLDDELAAEEQEDQMFSLIGAENLNSDSALDRHQVHLETLHEDVDTDLVDLTES